MRKAGNDDSASAAETRRRSARLRAYRRGHVAEWIALVFLLCKGYWPLARRFAAHGGEVDLIMRRGGVIAFVEVKARREVESAVYAIDRNKRSRFSRAVNAWLMRHPEACERSLRCDAVYIIRGWRPLHIEGAFQLD